ncbi:MAG TPA: glycosyltransferase family 4 protein [Burkholderiales bacterium]|jgi:glycosyltransferase involved in cell wall biosynthesis|nr:glycosyltransferase family 4 protein [Burkholderiales bacterium]
MLNRAHDAYVVHVAGVRDGEALETLCRTTAVIAAVGVKQVLLDYGHGAGAIWPAALPVEVRPLRATGPSLFAKVRALQSAFSTLACERMLYAVHLHGAGPCLLGSHALKGTALPGRVLYSPHLAHAGSSWTVALLSRLLQRFLQPHDCAAVTASLAEAQTLSRLLNRSAEVLPNPVDAMFFEVDRRESARPDVLVDGFGAEAVEVVTRLSILLNARASRVAIAWLSAAGAEPRARLHAANVEVLDVADEAARARLLSKAWAYVHLAAGNRVPYGVAQAMAAGVPCLVSDTPSHRALIRHGETGFVCTSERDLLERLIHVLRDAEERQDISEAARAEAKRRFTSKHFEKAILRAYGFSSIAKGPARALQVVRMEKARHEITL